MPDHLRAWLVLARAHVRVNELQSLLDEFGDINNIVTQPRSELAATRLAQEKCEAITSPDERDIDNALSWLDAERRHLVCWGESDYPELLGQVPGPPMVLYVNGDVDALHLPALAIVGSRNPTQGGRRNAHDFAQHLASGGLSITSGMAQGIDAAAHQGALDAGGRTVAFLGTGIDRVYPPANRALAHAIAERGALVSEYPLGSPPEKWHFPERNRLISGLSLGTLVVEAARRSGSLITARLAAEQGREVFALPGSIHNPLARGCHELIRQGAKLVETADDILAELGQLTGHLRPSADDTDYEILRGALSHDPVGIEELGKQSGLTIDQLSSMLLILELHGEVESLSGGRFALTGQPGNQTS
ncbi:MAG: DNA-processing protein DprA [Woeseiaceae bacterium]|nr:DNA-processing protein DprA [Woeseiaceae bacterium]